MVKSVVRPLFCFGFEKENVQKSQYLQGFSSLWKTCDRKPPACSQSTRATGLRHTPLIFFDFCFSLVSACFVRPLASHSRIARKCICFQFSLLWLHRSQKRFSIVFGSLTQSTRATGLRHTPLRYDNPYIIADTSPFVKSHSERIHPRGFSRVVICMGALSLISWRKWNPRRRRRPSVR